MPMMIWKTSTFPGMLRFGRRNHPSGESSVTTPSPSSEAHADRSDTSYGFTARLPLCDARLLREDVVSLQAAGRVEGTRSVEERHVFDVSRLREELLESGRFMSRGHLNRSTLQRSEHMYAGSTDVQHAEMHMAQRVGLREEHRSIDTRGIHTDATRNRAIDQQPQSFSGLAAIKARFSSVRQKSSSAAASSKPTRRLIKLVNATIVRLTPPGSQKAGRPKDHTNASTTSQFTTAEHGVDLRENHNFVGGASSKAVTAQVGGAHPPDGEISNTPATVPRYAEEHGREFLSGLPTAPLNNGRGLAFSGAGPALASRVELPLAFPPTALALHYNSPNAVPDFTLADGFDLCDAIPTAVRGSARDKRPSPRVHQEEDYHNANDCSTISCNCAGPDRDRESGMSPAHCECAAETQWNATGPDWRALAMWGAPDSDTGDSGDALHTQLGRRMRVEFLSRNNCQQNIERWLHDQAGVTGHKREIDAWIVEEGTGDGPRYEQSVCIDSDGGRTCAHFCVCQHPPRFFRATRPSRFAKVKKRWYDGVLLAQNCYRYGNPHNPHIIEKSRKLSDEAIVYQRRQKTCPLDAGENGYVRNDERGRQMPIGARWRGRLGRMVRVMNVKRVRMREAFQAGAYVIREEDDDQ